MSLKPCGGSDSTSGPKLTRSYVGTVNMNEGSNKSGIQHEGTETPSGSAYEGGEQVDRRVQAWEKLVADSETRIERINSEIDRMFASLSTEQRILTRRKRKLQEALNDARV